MKHNEFGESTRQFRRGAIMGLTIAEVFILLVFALLLLLLLRYAQEEKDAKTLNDPINREIVIALETYALDDKKRLSELINQAGFLETFDRQRTLANKMQDIPEEFLVSDDARETLLEVSQLPPEQKFELMKLVRSDRLPRLLQEQEILTEILDSDHDAEDIRTYLEGEELVSRAISEKIQERVGQVVEQYGGNFGNDGTISLPSQGNFKQGAATLTDEFKHFLSEEEFCERLLQQLMDCKQHIRAVRIEGHTSSEWDTVETQLDKFLENLQLSQNRAQAVAEYCLRSLDNAELLDWSTKHLTAVGFSSQRPILGSDGSEDQVQSRRVAFSYIIKQDQSSFKENPCI